MLARKVLNAYSIWWVIKCVVFPFKLIQNFTIIFSVAGQSGNSLMIMICQISYVYQTLDVEHSCMTSSRHSSFPLWAWREGRMATLWIWSRNRSWTSAPLFLIDRKRIHALWKLSVSQLWVLMTVPPHVCNVWSGSSRSTKYKMNIRFLFAN